MEFLLHHKLKMIESKLKFKIKYFIEFCVCETFMTALYRSSLKLSTDWVVADTQYYVATLLQYIELSVMLGRDRKFCAYLPSVRFPASSQESFRMNVPSS